MQLPLSKPRKFLNAYKRLIGKIHIPISFATLHDVTYIADVSQKVELTLRYGFQGRALEPRAVPVVDRAAAALPPAKAHVAATLLIDVVPRAARVALLRWRLVVDAVEERPTRARRLHIVPEIDAVDCVAGGRAVTEDATDGVW